MSAGKFILSCCSTVDLPYDYLKKREIPVLQYTYTIDGKEYADDMWRDPDAYTFFYRMLEEGFLPHTSQINTAGYTAFFEELLRQGDVLHLAFSSGQSASVNNAYMAAKELKATFPDRNLVVIDSLCSSTGYGMLTDITADLRDSGHTLEETAEWVLANRNRLHHQFFSSNMSQFHRTGRVTGVAAGVATVLGICPLMRLDTSGSIKAYHKVRGKKRAIKATVDEAAAHAQDGENYNRRMWVCHSNCPEDAHMLMDALEGRFPRVKNRIRLFDIGPVIASHSGPGTVAVFFMGDERPVM